MHREEKELDEDLEQQLDWVKIEELDAISTTSLNKRALEKVDEMSVDTFGTEAFRISAKKTCKALLSTSQSTQGLRGPWHQNNISSKASVEDSN